MVEKKDTVKFGGYDLKFVGSNSDKGRISEVVYEVADTWGQYKIRIAARNTYLIYKGEEREYADLASALDVIVLNEQALQQEVCITDLATYSDAYFFLNAQMAHKAMLRAKQPHNRTFFQERLKFYADELVRRGVMELNDKGQYVRKMTKNG